jgi:eukaryotic-like serine/threonine-protein kinase
MEEMESPLPNATLSHYRLVSKIGAGGMGEVYLAQDTKLDRRVALKILPQQFAEDKDRMSRFVREARAASALNHPNIITIHEIGESEGIHFIATEFIDGQTLSDYAKGAPPQLKTVLELAIQIASTLDEAPSAGIVHRDMKPDNVMVRANGLVKILDFGIAADAKTSNRSALQGNAETAESPG